MTLFIVWVIFFISIKEQDKAIKFLHECMEGGSKTDCKAGTSENHAEGTKLVKASSGGKRENKGAHRKCR